MRATWGKGSRVDADVCIVGAGPAGIAIARALANSSLRVTLLESGGLEPDPRAQQLGDGNLDSRNHAEHGLRDGRQRQFGGTSNLWVYETIPADGHRYARSLPPEPRDLTAGSFAWPISLQTLEPYYQRAQSFWNGGSYDYSLARWSLGSQPLSLPNVVTRISQHGSSDVFRGSYRDDLLAAENVTVMLGVTAIEVQTDGTRTAQRLLAVTTADREPVTVTAKAFVLAAGGIENAQLLLLSDATKPGGPANRHDNVGRFLTDHPEFRMGILQPAREDWLESIALYDLRWVDGRMVSAFLTLSEALKDEEALLNLSAALVPHWAGFGSGAHKGLARLRAAARRELSPDAVSATGAVLRSPMTALRLLRKETDGFEEYHGGWSSPTADRRSLMTIELHASSEQTPSRNNQVTLSSELDVLGRPRPRVSWQWSNEDRVNIERSIGLLAGAIQDAGAGTFVRWGSLDGPLRPYAAGLHHPMGTTRMDPSPKGGVVDLDCRVHGLENLFVAGSSVFPNGHGYANPTLSILALAIRLADRIQLELQTAGASSSDSIPADATLASS